MLHRCEDCTHLFWVPGQAGGLVQGNCPNCQAPYRLTVPGAADDSRLNDMVDPSSGEDQGGNPLQEGILGDWKPAGQRDESFPGQYGKVAVDEEGPTPGWKQYWGDDPQAPRVPWHQDPQHADLHLPYQKGERVHVESPADPENGNAALSFDGTYVRPDGQYTGSHYVQADGTDRPLWIMGDDIHPISAPQIMQHPDPWMDNEPGATTFPEEWNRQSNWWKPEYWDHVNPVIGEHADDGQQLAMQMGAMAMRHADELAEKGQPGAFQVLIHEMRGLPDQARDVFEQQWLEQHPEYNFGSDEYNQRRDLADEMKGLTGKTAGAEWRPGKPGKFIVDPQGNVHAWNAREGGTEADGPIFSHDQYAREHSEIDAEEMGNDLWSESPSWTLGWIHPDGRIQPLDAARNRAEHGQLVEQRVPGTHFDEENSWELPHSGHVSDEVQSSLKTAEFPDDDIDFSLGMEGFNPEPAFQASTHKFIVGPGGRVLSAPEPTTHEEIAASSGQDPESLLRAASLGQLFSDGTTGWFHHASGLNPDELQRAIGEHFGRPVKIDPSLKPSSNEDRWGLGQHDPAEMRDPLFPDKVRREQEMMDATRRHKPFPYYENPVFNRGGKVRVESNSYLSATFPTWEEAYFEKVAVGPNEVEAMPGKYGLHNDVLRGLQDLGATVNGRPLDAEWKGYLIRHHSPLGQMMGDSQWAQNQGKPVIVGHEDPRKLEAAKQVVETGSYDPVSNYHRDVNGGQTMDVQLPDGQLDRDLVQVLGALDAYVNGQRVRAYHQQLMENPTPTITVGAKDPQALQAIQSYIDTGSNEAAKAYLSQQQATSHTAAFLAPLAEGAMAAGGAEAGGAAAAGGAEGGGGMMGMMGGGGGGGGMISGLMHGAMSPAASILGKIPLVGGLFGGGGQQDPNAPAQQEQLRGLDALAAIDTLDSIPGAETNDPSKIDPHEMDDGTQQDAGQFYEPGLDSRGVEVSPNEFDPDGAGMERFKMLLPLVQHYYDSDEDGSHDPLLQGLHQSLEMERPGYLEWHKQTSFHEAGDTWDDVKAITNRALARCQRCGYWPNPAGGACPKCGLVSPSVDYLNWDRRDRAEGYRQPDLRQDDTPGATTFPEDWTSAYHEAVQTIPGMNPGVNEMAQSSPIMPAAQPGAANLGVNLCPECGAPLAGNGQCAHCGYGAGTQGQPRTLQPQVPQMPQAPQATLNPGVNPTFGKTAEAEGGPKTREQFQAVAEYLTQNGREAEIPNMIQHPEMYVEELAAVQQEQAPPQIDPTDVGQAPPPPMGVPGAMPGGAPMAGPPGVDPTQQMVAAINRYAADHVAPKCPACGSHTTSLLNSNGDCECATCHNIWAVDDLVPANEAPAKIAEFGDRDEPARGPADMTPADRPNVVDAPAAEQDGHRDVEQEQDSSLTWRDIDDQPLQEGETYEIHERRFPIPEIAQVTRITPDAIYYVPQGEYNLGKERELKREDKELYDSQFVPVGLDNDQGDDVADSQPEPQQATYPTTAPGETSDLSHPHSSVLPKVNLTQAVLGSAPGNVCQACGTAQHVSSSMISPFEHGHDCFRCGAKWTSPVEVPPDVASGGAGRDWLRGSSGGGLSHVGVEQAQLMGDPMASMGLPDMPPQVGAPAMGGSKNITRMAGKRYSPYEQREFIDEPGEARNMDRLNLAGTHYEDTHDVGAELALGF